MTKRISLSQKLIASLLILVPIAYMFFIDPNLVSSYRESLLIHAASAAALISDPKDLFGIPGLLERTSGIFIAAIVVTLALVCVIGVLCGRKFYTIDRWEMLFCALLLCGVLLVPTMDDDLAVLAVLFAVASKQAQSMQVILLFPMLFLWRPNLLLSIGFTEMEKLTMVTAIGLCLSAFFLGLAYTGRIRPKFE